MNGDSSEPSFAGRIRHARETARSLTIYHISPDVSTIRALSPDALETFLDVKIETIDDAETIAAIFDAIEASEPVESRRPLDARYSLAFADALGERVLTVAKGALADRGQIDRDPCQFNEFALDDWLYERYPGPVETELGEE